MPFALEALGISLATLCDEDGALGHVQQSLVIENRAAAASLEAH